MATAAECDLERMLRLAATDPGHRPEFYRLLLEEMVYVPGSTTPDDPAIPESVTRLAVINWQKADGTLIVPVFTSAEMAERALQPGQPWVSLPGRALFTALAGQSFVLNPRSPHGVEIPPAMVAGLLDGSLLAAPAQVNMRAGTQYYLGLPAQHPGPLLSALVTLLNNQPEVEEGWYAQIHVPDSGIPPHLIIGLKIAVGADIGGIAGAMSRVAADILPPGEPADITVLGDDAMGRDLRRHGRCFFPSPDLNPTLGSRLKNLLGMREN